MAWLFVVDFPNDFRFVPRHAREQTMKAEGREGPQPRFGHRRYEGAEKMTAGQQ